MRCSNRHTPCGHTAIRRILACLLALPWVCMAAPREQPSFALSALKLGVPDFPQLYVSALRAGGDGKQEVALVALDVPDQSPGAEVRIPVGSVVRLYAAVDGQAPGTGAAPFLEIPAPKGGVADGKYFLIFHPGQNGRLQQNLVEASARKHPGGSVRLINLAEKRIAFSVGSSPQPVPPGGDVLAIPVPGEKGRFSFTYSEERPGEAPYQSPRMNLRFKFPDQRLLVVYAHEREETATGETTPDGREKMAVNFRPRPIMVFDRCGEVPSPSGAPAPVEACVWVGGSGGHGSKGLTLETPGGGAAVPLVAGSDNTARVSLTPGTDGRVRVLRDGLEVAGAQLPQGTDRAVLALAPPVDESGTPSLLAFDGSRQSHPDGRRRLFNLTPYQMAYRPDGGPIVYINPREAVLLTEAKGSGQLQLAVLSPAGWKKLDNFPAAAKRGGRAGIFVFTDGSSSTFRISETEL